MKLLHFQLFAYVLMSNHVHLVLQTSKTRPIHIVMHHINLMFAKKYNQLHERCGHLWMNRYGARLVTTPAQLIATMRYVMRNPLRAGIVTELDDWPWSSYHYYCGTKQDPLITPAPIQESEVRRVFYQDLLTQNWPSDNRL